MDCDKMCDVCVANTVLQAGPKGHEISWTGVDWKLYMRARGSEPEGPGFYQIRREGEGWGEEWKRTECLANVVLWLGFSEKFSTVPEEVKQYIRGQRDDLPVRKIWFRRPKGKWHLVQKETDSELLSRCGYRLSKKRELQYRWYPKQSLKSRCKKCEVGL